MGEDEESGHRQTRVGVGRIFMRTFPRPEANLTAQRISISWRASFYL